MSTGLDPTRDTALAYLAAFDTGDPDLIAAFVSGGFRNLHASALGADSRGREEYRRRLPDFLGAFGGPHYEPIEVVVDAPVIAVRYRFIGMFDAHPIDLTGVMWLEVHEGLVTRRIDHWDSLTFLEQTGGWPSDASGR